MKKSIIVVFSVITFISLTAFSVLHWTKDGGTQLKCTPPELDLVYNVESRFKATITKADLQKASSILDIVPEEANWRTMSFHSIRVAVLLDGDELVVRGDHTTLNEGQLALLQTADYSTNFYIKAHSTTNHPRTGRTEDYVYYMTIVPEKQATYSSGHDALIAHLRAQSKEATAPVREEHLEAGQINFTITKAGTVANVKLASTSGYPFIDQALIEILTTLPEKWYPAENEKGEKVDQDLVFFFGKEGC